MNKQEIVQRLGEIKQEKKQLKKQLKELPSLEVGKWYITDANHKFVIIEKIDNVWAVCYGFTTGDSWYENGNRCVLNNDFGARLMTNKEVETALIKEAKKRGFKEGVNIKGMITGNRSLLKKGVLFLDHLEWLRMGVHNSYAPVIFKNGKWAEIIEEPKTITLNGKYNRIQLTDILNNQL